MNATAYGRNAAVGVASGLAAALIMDIFQKGLSVAKSELEQHEGEQRRSTGETPLSSSEPSTLKLADRLSQVFTGGPIPGDDRRTASNLVHYGFAAVLGGVYGGIGEAYPKIRTGFGLLYGMGVWAVADETMVPVLGLSPPPQKVPLSTHLYALASHVVFAAKLEACRRAIEAALAAADETLILSARTRHIV